AGHHDALRAVPVPRLLLGAPLAHQQGGRAVRAGFPGSRIARCPERRGDADHRLVAQDLAEDHDPRHARDLPEAHVTGGERPSGAIVRTALFAILFMGSVLVYVPYILASGPGTAHWTLGPWRDLGLLPLAAGIAGLGRCLRDFAVVGRGTTAPFGPTPQLVATGLYRWVRNRMHRVARGVVAPRPSPPQHLGDRAAHGLLEVHRAPPPEARSRARVSARREQLAGAPREARRGRVAARRRAAQGAAPAAPGGHRSLSRGAAQRPGVAVHLDERAARVRHRLARFV